MRYTNENGELPDELNLIIHDLDKIEQFVREFHSLDLLADYKELIFHWANADHLKAAIRELAKERDSASAYRSLTAFSAYSSRLDSLTAQVNISAGVEQIIQTAANAWSGLANQIQSVVKGISSTLFQFISQMLTPKEWSISGELGVNVGIMTNAGIEITFGP